MTGTPATDKAGNRVRAVLRDESEVAHVWQADVQSHGRFRAIYFSGRRLYSYGSHYVIGQLLPDGSVMLNSESNSMTTNGHRRAADYATQHRRQLYVPDLTAALRIADDVESSRRSLKRERREGADISNPESYGFRVKTRLDAERKAGRRFVRDAIRSKEGLSDDAALALLKLFAWPASSLPAIKREAEAATIREARESAALEKRRRLHDAERFAAMSDSDFEESLPDDGYAAPSWQRGKSYHAKEQESFVKRLRAAHAEAKRAGFAKRKLAKLAERLKQARDYAAGRDARIEAAELEKLRDDFRAWKAGNGSKPNSWRYDRPELAAEHAELSAADDAERSQRLADEFAKWKRGEAKRIPSADSYPEGSAERAELEAAERQHWTRLAMELESWRAGLGDKPDDSEFILWERYAPAELRERVGGDPWRELLHGYSKADCERMKAEAAEAERLRNADLAEKRDAWRNGAELRALGEHRLDDGDGGALLRIEGEGDGAELVTSQGARVPLSHAVKAFRFVKLIRETNGQWQRNGRTVRVGHYSLDSIDPAGFNAGCHRINWPEIERVAKLAGVFELPPSDAAAEPSNVAA
jgi:hypothetical protein